jgi:hypothetical protein
MSKLIINRKNSKSNQIPLAFTQEQNEFFTGLMLGDGGLTWGKTSNFPRLSMTRQVQDKDYLFWQYDIFKDFYGTEPKHPYIGIYMGYQLIPSSHITPKTTFANKHISQVSYVVANIK